MMDHRTCRICHDDRDVKHVSTNLEQRTMTFRCMAHDTKVEWTIRFGPEPRPRFDSQPLEAA